MNKTTVKGLFGFLLVLCIGLMGGIIVAVSPQYFKAFALFFLVPLMVTYAIAYVAKTKKITYKTVLRKVWHVLKWFGGKFKAVGKAIGRIRLTRKKPADQNKPVESQQTKPAS